VIQVIKLDRHFLVHQYLPRLCVVWYGAEILFPFPADGMHYLIIDGISFTILLCITTNWYLHARTVVPAYGVQNVMVMLPTRNFNIWDECIQSKKIVFFGWFVLIVSFMYLFLKGLSKGKDLFVFRRRYAHSQLQWRGWRTNVCQSIYCHVFLFLSCINNDPVSCCCYWRRQQQQQQLQRRCRERFY